MTTVLQQLQHEGNTQAINQLVALLHLFNHRNKNQHRRSIWWRHFSTLRRQLTRLNDEISDLTTQPPTHVERARLKAQRPLTESRIQQRLKFWQDILVPKWHRAFSQLAADGRYAALGLVLVALLAQICTLTGIVTKYEELEEAEVQKTLAEFGREQWASGMSPAEEVGGKAATEDLGISLAREAAVPAKPLQTAEKKNTSKIRRMSKKQKPRDNAIDDLFSSVW